MLFVKKVSQLRVVFPIGDYFILLGGFFCIKGGFCAGNVEDFCSHYFFVSKWE